MSRACWAVDPAGARRGFTLIEVLVVIAIVGALGAVVMDRLLVYQEMAEKAAMEQTVTALRSALRLQVAERLLRSGFKELPELARMNPMDWLAQTPGNYAGERRQNGDVSAGNWYYDANARQLVYLPRRHAHLDSGGAKAPQIRFEVRLLYRKSAKEQSLADDEGMVEGVVLAPVHAYRWF